MNHVPSLSSGAIWILSICPPVLYLISMSYPSYLSNEYPSRLSCLSTNLWTRLQMCGTNRLSLFAMSLRITTSIWRFPKMVVTPNRQSHWTILVHFGLNTYAFGDPAFWKPSCDSRTKPRWRSFGSRVPTWDTIGRGSNHVADLAHGQVIGFLTGYQPWPWSCWMILAGHAIGAAS